MDLKKILASQLVTKVKDGDCIGLGTGTTAEEVTREIARRVKDEKLNISAVSSSIATTSLATDLGIKVVPISKASQVTWGFDGADEVSPDKSLIKGKGGALLKEKIISGLMPEWIILVTENKLVTNLGMTCPLPVEVVPAAVSIVEKDLLSLGATSIKIRTGSHFYGPLFTESGNLLIDAEFPCIDDQLTRQIKLLTGVVEHGYFPANVKNKILVAKDSGETYWY